MQKEFEKQEKLKTLDEEHRKQYEEELKHQQQKHNQHEKIHHPGNKAQLEEGLYRVMNSFHNIHLTTMPIVTFFKFKCGKNKIIWIQRTLNRKSSL